MATTPVTIGIIGCGAISDLYFRGVGSFDVLDIKACADLIAERAEAKAEAFGVRACSVQELLSDPEIQIVINLTVPGAHGEIGLERCRRGKACIMKSPSRFPGVMAGGCWRSQGQRACALAVRRTPSWGVGSKPVENLWTMAGSANLSPQMPS